MYYSVQIEAPREVRFLLYFKIYWAYLQAGHKYNPCIAWILYASILDVGV